jgi:hypothetical protein
MPAIGAPTRAPAVLCDAALVGTDVAEGTGNGGPSVEDEGAAL